MRKEKPVLAITIDCECDKSSDWTTSDPLRFDSIREGIPRRLQPLFNRFSAVPTYLLSNEVIEDDASVEAIRSLEGAFELGAHLHADYMYPEKKHDRYEGTRVSAYQSDYPFTIEKEKLFNLTELFKARFGYRPLSFRAGRFGAGAHTIRILEELGYKVDSSVHPGLKILTKTGRIDFLKCPDMPYFADREDISSHGGSSILEVPVTVVKHPVMKNVFSRMRIADRKTFGEKLLNKVFPSVTLRPTFFTADQMIEASKNLIWKMKGGFAVLNMMFHSMEIIPGASPYAHSAPEAGAFIDKMSKYLEWWKSEGYGYSGLTGLYDKVKVNYE